MSTTVLQSIPPKKREDNSRNGGEESTNHPLDKELKYRIHKEILKFDNKDIM